MYTCGTGRLWRLIAFAHCGIVNGQVKYTCFGRRRGVSGAISGKVRLGVCNVRRGWGRGVGVAGKNVLCVIHVCTCGGIDLTTNTLPPGYVSEGGVIWQLPVAVTSGNPSTHTAIHTILTLNC